MIVILFCSHALCAQQTVADAELSFAKLAVDSGIKKAFLHYLDSNSVIVANGRFQDGLSFYQNNDERGGQLLWRPVYTGISVAGDLGFSTGPYEFRSSPSDTVVRGGQYSSVWKKDAAGNWKVLIDLGTSSPSSLFTSLQEQTIYHSNDSHQSGNAWKEPEEKLAKGIAQHGMAVFSSYINENSWFNLPGQFPYTTPATIAGALQKLPANITFQPEGGGISAAGDMIYAYGWMQNADKKNSYLRVWVWQQSGWKLALQVISHK